MRKLFVIVMLLIVTVCFADDKEKFVNSYNYVRGFEALNAEDYNEVVSYYLSKEPEERLCHAVAYEFISREIWKGNEYSRPSLEAKDNGVYDFCLSNTNCGIFGTGGHDKSIGRFFRCYQDITAAMVVRPMFLSVQL